MMCEVAAAAGTWQRWWAYISGGVIQSFQIHRTGGYISDRVFREIIRKPGIRSHFPFQSSCDDVSSEEALQKRFSILNLSGVVRARFVNVSAGVTGLGVCSFLSSQTLLPETMCPIFT